MVVGLVLGLYAVGAAVRWLAEHWWIPAGCALVAAAVGAAWWRVRAERRRWEAVRAAGLRMSLDELDALHHTRFEYAVRDLMYRDGCADAVRTGGRGDNGADVKATDPHGRHWVIQCKHRAAGWDGAAIGTPDLHVLNGTARQVHGADVVVLVTNGRFSRNAAPFARSQRIHLVDRHLLARWAAGPQPLWTLLDHVPPAR
ncbi:MULTISPECIES: restriction endonuclease [unclassified Streptomyces]|uniref:restriction endonuclease n=1 Tax=unclassified Streptomyces TaxID=2593676 RepID=UPI001F38F3B7|nr:MULTISPECIES: restriction endonuclease [unclassified Streptomyces]